MTPRPYHPGALQLFARLGDFSEADLVEGPAKGLFGALGWTMGDLFGGLHGSRNAALASCEAAE